MSRFQLRITGIGVLALATILIAAIAFWRAEPRAEGENEVKAEPQPRVEQTTAAKLYEAALQQKDSDISH